MDVKLEEFIEVHAAGVTNESIMESLIRLKDTDLGLLSCLDYLMAAADYQDFISLMLDFRDGFEWEDSEYGQEGKAADNFDAVQEQDE